MQSNTTSTMPQVSAAEMLGAAKRLRERHQRVQPIDHLALGSAAMAYMRSCSHLVPSDETQEGVMAALQGFKVYEEATLPPDVMEFRDADGRVISRCTIGKRE